MNIAQLTAFLVPTLALNLTPGPDMFFVVSRSLKGGVPAAVKGALGLWLGYLFHIGLVCLGVAGLLTKFPQAFALMKVAGSLYLLFLSAKMFFGRKESEEGGRGAEGKASFSEGIFVSALNPKVAVFFLAFLPQFVVAGPLSPASQLLELGLIFSLTSTVVNLGAAGAALLFKGREAAPRLSLEPICGLVMMGMAARLAFGG